MKYNATSSRDKDVKSERVLVHVRIKPMTEDDLALDRTTPIEVVDTNNNSMTIKKEYEKKNFSYDTIFPTSAKQKDIFERTTRPVIDSVLDGYNGTIFAYGQTGTGKTYTMVGEFQDENVKGIIPRSFDYIFNKVNKQNTENAKYTITVSFIQIYLETIQDLLNLNNQVRIREDVDQGVFLENVEWIKVTSTAQCGEVFTRGEKNRVTECTKMNAHSSRSHALLICKIEKSFCDTNSQDHVMTKSMLYLVDLAGSERVTKTKAKEMRLEEAKKINYSLLVLGNCIQSLTDPKTTHVSYRDSKLTRILQESLGGNAKTSLIVTISSSTYNAEESISSLYFGSRAMKVQNKPVINKTEDFQAQCFKLQEDYDRLMDAYSKLKIEYDRVVEENNLLKNSETYLDLQRKSLQNKFSSGKGGGESKGQSSEAYQKEIEELKNKYDEELKTLEKYYKEVMHNKTVDLNKDLKKKTDKLLRKDNEIETLNTMNTELSMKLDAYSENIKDLAVQNDDLQKTVNDLLEEKDNLIQHLNEIENMKASLENKNDELTQMKKANEDAEKERKKGIRYAQTQTEMLLDKSLKDALEKMSINIGNGSSYIQIITDLIKQRETIDTANTFKMKKISDANEQMRKANDDKIAQYLKDIEQLKLNNKSLIDEKTKFDNVKKDIQAKSDKEIDQLKSAIRDMETAQQAKTKEFQEQQAKMKEYEQKLYEYDNNAKIHLVNSQNAVSDIKGLQNNLTIHEKSLNKLLGQLTNDLAVYSAYKKELKKFDSIFKCDLNNTNNNNKSIEIFITKLKNQLSKVKDMLTNPQTLMTNIQQAVQSQLNYETKDVIIRISDSLNESNSLMMSFIHSYTKLSKLFLDQFKAYKSLDESYNQLATIETNMSKKNEAYIKGALILLLKQKIQKFSSLCFKNNVEDLLLKVNMLSNQIDKLQGDEIMKNTSTILEDLILRISSFKDEKQLEIEALNEKIIQLLRELDLTNKQLNMNVPKDTAVNQQMTLKNEEINRLNKVIESHLTKIKSLSCENSLLKSSKSSENIKALGSMNDYTSKLEEKLNNYQTELMQLSNQKSSLNDKVSGDSSVEKETKNKNEFYKKRLNDNNNNNHNNKRK